MIEIVIYILAVIGAFTAVSAIIIIAVIIIPEIWRNGKGSSGEIRTTCSLNDEYCPHDSEDNFLDCGDCEVYKEYKKTEIDRRTKNEDYA